MATFPSGYAVPHSESGIILVLQSYSVLNRTGGGSSEELADATEFLIYKRGYREIGD